MKKILPLSYIELSKNNLIYNIKVFKNLAKKGVKFSVAVKGNAYGHGLKEIVKIANSHVDYFQVDSIEELELLRQNTNKKTFVFGYVQKFDLQKAMQMNCILSVFSLKHLKYISDIALAKKIKQEIHLPIDAYLGREGFLLEELPEILKEIKKHSFLKLTGVYAHFANIEDTSDFSHAYKQIKEYENALDLIKKFNFKNIQTHISATSGLLVYEKNKGINPLIRLGIGMYGMWPSEHLKFLYKGKMELKPVLSWKTKIAQIKILPKGNTIGYGLTYKTQKDTKIAIIPVGYADGLDRRFSNNGCVLIQGEKCKILGRVMMNMCVVDITSLKGVDVEDEVVILGYQGSDTISAEEMANKINTINYEITTRMNPLLPRIVV